MIYFIQEGGIWEEITLTRLGKSPRASRVWRGKSFVISGLAFTAGKRGTGKSGRAPLCRDGFAERYTLDTEYLRVLHLDKPGGLYRISQLDRRAGRSSSIFHKNAGGWRD